MAGKIWPSYRKDHELYREILYKKANMLDWFAKASQTNNTNVSSYCTRSQEVASSLHRHIDTFIRKDPEDEKESDSDEEIEVFNDNLDRIRSLTIYYDSSGYKDWAYRGKGDLLQFFGPKQERLSIIDTNEYVSAYPSRVYTFPSPNLKYLS